VRNTVHKILKAENRRIEKYIEHDRKEEESSCGSKQEGPFFHIRSAPLWGDAFEDLTNILPHCGEMLLKI
jgi:hypothetical protein